MKRAIQLFTLFATALTVVGCVKRVEPPAVTGPSTFAHSIVMFATTDTLTQNGVDFTDITVTSISPTGQSENIPLRAQVFVDGIAMDFGTLSTKTPTTPATIRYTAPAASALTAQVPTTVTIRVTPTSNGDFRSEFARQLDIRVLPQGIIIPTNPNLAALFSVNPASPQAFQTTTFDASTSTINGIACLDVCTYAWSFGDGNTATGRTVNHQFRTAGNKAVTLTVTDARGAQSISTQNVVVTSPTPPVGAIDVTPSSPVVGQDVFFSASRTTSPTGRAIVSYEWNFGDGRTSSGVTTSHRYTAQGTYTVSLRVTDEVGAVHTVNSTVSVGAGGPSAVTFTILPASPRVNQTVTINITATPVGATTIRSYTINWGDASIETVTAPTQSHVYSSAGTYVITVTATDSLGHTRTTTQSVTVAP